MRMVVSLDKVAARLFAALVLAPLAGCGSGNGGGGVGVAACDGATPVVALGQDSGYEQCEGGWLHRKEVVVCASALPRATTCDAAGTTGGCTTDADCIEQPNGHCDPDSFGAGGCYCEYGCVQDSDCAAGQICVCGDPVGYCSTASCSSDADCGGDALCATYITEPGCGGFAYACQTGADECSSDADCPADHQCTLEGDHRVCGAINCVIGRPFLVHGEARVAGVTARRDWCAEGLSPATAGLPAAIRDDLAAEWARSAQMEHASIAAFARFAMQLLSLGAPPDLLVATHAAMADETEHARACFALASAYAGAHVGPGPLSLDGALAGGDAAAIVRLAVLEGCIGETVAAVEAAEAASRAEDPVVAAVLAKIAEDESRHAELAWRFVRWAIAADPALAGVADGAFAAALADELGRGARGTSAEDEAWMTHGVARGTVKAEIRRRVLEAVVAPTARALRAPGGAGAAAERIQA
jgi:hypothetical protein